MLYIKIKSEVPPVCVEQEGNLIIKFSEDKMILVPKKIMDCIDGLKWISLDDEENLISAPPIQVEPLVESENTGPPSKENWKVFKKIAKSTGVGFWEIKYKPKNSSFDINTTTINHYSCMFSCNCPAWIYSKPVKTCKHIQTNVT